MELMLCRVAIVMEMLAANLFTVDLCATRKYSRPATAAGLAAFSTVLTIPTSGLWETMGFDRGDASFALIGVVFLLPLGLLYREGLSHLTSILFSVWIYTLLVYCLAVRAARLLPGAAFLPGVLLAQTALYGATFAFFTRWVRGGFLFVLRNIPPRDRGFLRLVSLGWFVSVIVVNNNLIYTDCGPLKAAAIASLAVNAALSYLLIYSMAVHHREARDLEGRVHTDNLTGLPNRAALFRDLRELMEQGAPFCLAFIDLNRFKQVNDAYGHAAGDRYLTAFSRGLAGRLAAAERLYRMSGDEFVVVSPARERGTLARRLREYEENPAQPELPFLGMSVGTANFPEEETSPDRILMLADRRMYENKPAPGLR